MMEMARRRPSQPITAASRNTHNTSASRFNQWNNHVVPMDDDMDSAVNAVLQEESNVKVEKFPQ